ncbi:MAG: hypothetical protein L6R40_008023 [Gallowayella cf. fulva]|nr:MAG: hypothetical protein L6R40_008023 [Xanthomendoza cf. fulva]
MFEAGGRKNCEFDRSEDESAGVLFCNGVKAECTKLKTKETQCGQSKSFVEQVRCAFEPPPDGPAVPPPPSRLFAVGYFQTCKGKDCESAAGVFVPPEKDDDDKFFACIDKPLYRDQKMSQPPRPKYPQDITFEGGGRKNCKFTRSGDDSVGGMYCGKDDAKKCEKEKIVERDCKDFGKNEIWRTQVICEFDMVDGTLTPHRILIINHATCFARFHQPLLTIIIHLPPPTPGPRHSRSTTVKLDPRNTPPPLHFSPVTSEQERSSTADTTPIGTPKTFDTAFRRRSEKEREPDLLSSFYRKNPGFAGNTSSYVDSALLESDSEDSTFPLFQDTSAPDPNMATRNGHTTLQPRRPQTSNLTSALQSTSGNESRPTPAMNISNRKGPNGSLGHRDSSTGGLAASGSLHGSGTHPISMSSANRERPRRESLAGSMVSGMSWGTVSVNSWVRDEIIMQGTSPFPQQSPSFHSSSYIPKLEASFMKDFLCCGTIISSLHELLQHYEENHVDSIQPKNNITQISTPPDNKAAIASNAANAVRQSAQQSTQQPLQQTKPMQSTQSSVPSQTSSNPVTPRVQKAEPVAHDNFAASQHHPSLDMDAVQDMEMDDFDYDPQPKPTATSTWAMPHQSRMMQRSQFGQPASRMPPLDTNPLHTGNGLHQHQGLRQSNPSTPVTASRNGSFYHNNPTVSSVNTPTLTAHPMQQQPYTATPDSSVPVSPGEVDGDFVGGLGRRNGTMDMGAGNQFGAFGDYQFGDGHDMLGLCIDEPAKRLFSANGGYNNGNSGPKIHASKLGDAQYSENSELARTIREQQRLAGIPDGGSGPNDGVAKPFHCPVLGCEKAYKNQNGLKYHKNHGHNTQELHANENGTFSIVDPETRNPYPGTLGMEKHKPYRCDACGKRYKNLNGLKYHKNHSAACEDGKPLTDSMDTSNMLSQPSPGPNMPNFSQGGFKPANMSSMDTNTGTDFSATGLPGIDEEMIM